MDKGCQLRGNGEITRKRERASLFFSLLLLLLVLRFFRNQNVNTPEVVIVELNNKVRILSRERSSGRGGPRPGSRGTFLPFFSPLSLSLSFLHATAVQQQQRLRGLARQTAHTN